MTAHPGPPDDPHGEPPAIAAMFSRIARRYDLLNHLLSFGLDIYWRNLMARLARLRLGDRALDVATGTADSAFVLKTRVGPAGSVVGLDLTREMLLIGLAKVRSRHSDGIELQEGDAMHLPYRDCVFRAATMAFGGRNVPDLEGAFREMGRVLQPGGRAVFLELNRPTLWGFRQVFDWYFHTFSPLVGGLISGDRGAYEYLPRSVDRFEAVEDIGRIMARAGLRDIEVHRLMFGSAVIHVGVAPAD
ncbi:MAG TPA: ubiquinone/menaquinone biosynthesis methyltransferase [Dehalococcoidia bacterium]